MAAIFYEESPPADAHQAWFDMYLDVGTSIGKMMRYTLNFDPKAIDNNT